MFIKTSKKLHLCKTFRKSFEVNESSNHRVKAKAQLGEDELTPKELLVEKELHLATIPLVGKFENN